MNPSVRIDPNLVSSPALVAAAEDAATKACADGGGAAVISTPREGNGSNKMLPLAIAKAIIVQCDYTDNWFVHRRNWIVLGRANEQFATTGPHFDERRSAEAFATDPARFKQTEDVNVAAHLKRASFVQSLYHNLCFKAPFAGGAIEMKDEHHAVITCRVARGASGASLVRAVTLP